MNWQIKYKKKAWEFLSEHNLIEKFEANLKILIKGKGRVDVKNYQANYQGIFV